MSFISQILETAMYIFAGGGFRVGKGKGRWQGVGGGWGGREASAWVFSWIISSWWREDVRLAPTSGALRRAQPKPNLLFSQNTVLDNI